MRKVPILNTMPIKSQGQAPSGGNPTQNSVGTEITPAMKTVAVTAAPESVRERAAAFHEAWAMALSKAAKKGRISKAGLQLYGPRTRLMRCNPHKSNWRLAI
jgi:hypothetical protein